MIFYFKLPIPWLNQKTSLKGICICFELNSILSANQAKENPNIKRAFANLSCSTYNLYTCPQPSPTLVKGFNKITR